ncbi:DNA-binding protein [Saccharibacillus sp. O23]|uniref:DNA-binding protein n=1 Tax=Saccharibacillus sp. O23 TaxID=2009338 RepID=UPI000B4DFDF8|nr:DNA-binding protein [Saccharibacillus sp. O23]OWR31917.1 DNA-binding protein [Saccharibacillus sp. O23]
METGNALRSEIEKGIANLGLNFSGFSELSGINRGIFSAILNSNPPKPISLHQLELIGKALGQPEGWMFESYIDECFFDGKPNRRRVEPFLIRCAELGKKDCIDQVLSRLLDDLKHVATIFEIGESLYLSGKVQESLPFYECVIQNDRYNHSEKLAISHYRVFRASICEDHEINLRAAIRFESYCEKLPDYHRLDGLMNLIDVYFSLDKWEEAERYARELRMFSEVVYQMEQARMKQVGYEPIPTEKPLVVYYGYSFLSMENVMFHYEQYDEARNYLSGYEDLSHFKILDEQGLKQVKRFSKFAKQNRMYIDLHIGNREQALDQCKEFLKEHPEVSFMTILNLISAANSYNLDIATLIETYSEQVENYIKEETHDRKKMIKSKFYIDMHYEKAIYYLKRGQHNNSIISVLKALNIAVKIKSADRFMHLVPLFEILRSYASENQVNQYTDLMKGELKFL